VAFGSELGGDAEKKSPVHPQSFVQLIFSPPDAINTELAHCARGGEVYEDQ
jgi:hypothetical protein